LVREVGNARVYDGVHYRFSTEVGTDMGQRIGALAVQRFLGE
jgi:membrane-associated phospholipid phosphatase